MVQNLEVMDLVELIGDIAKKQIDNDEIFLVDVVVKGKTGNQKIQVFIDGDQSVDIDECSKISRRLSDELEERNLI
jgi:ribosome maturation factor RimP